MRTQPFLIHALSALHSGTGHASGVIDLPIARMKATGIPYLPGTSVKGVLREACRPQANAGPEYENWLAIFGPPTEEAHLHAGALVFGDARLLALPVASFRGTFAWVTSPLLLFLAARDLGPGDCPVPTFPGRGAVLPAGEHKCAVDGRIYLADLDIDVVQSEQHAAEAAGEWARTLAPHVAPDHEEIFARRFVVVDDDTMAYLWEHQTQVDAHIRINRDTGTVAEGALWLEESLPSETVLLGLAAAEAARREGVSLSAERVLACVLGRGPMTLQFGGHATSGKGRCRFVPLDARGGDA